MRTSSQLSYIFVKKFLVFLTCYGKNLWWSEVQKQHKHLYCDERDNYEVQKFNICKVNYSRGKVEIHSKRTLCLCLLSLTLEYEDLTLEDKKEWNVSKRVKGRRTVSVRSQVKHPSFLFYTSFIRQSFFPMPWSQMGHRQPTQRK